MPIVVIMHSCVINVLLIYDMEPYNFVQVDFVYNICFSIMARSLDLAIIWTLVTNGHMLSGGKHVVSVDVWDFSPDGSATEPEGQ
jgi:hypothetical protein